MQQIAGRSDLGVEIGDEPLIERGGTPPESGQFRDQVVDLGVCNDQSGEVAGRLSSIGAEPHGFPCEESIRKCMPRPGCVHGGQMMPCRVATATACARFRQFIFISTSWTMFFTVRSE